MLPVCIILFISQRRGSHLKDSKDRTTAKGQGTTGWPACMQSPSDVLVTSTHKGPSQKFAEAPETKSLRLGGGGGGGGEGVGVENRKPGFNSKKY